ncbi:hypothetical protein [Pseudoxanthomonas sp. X-1]|uniref:hypothetical protein n=1 Tax=Pseudoxanthomonas sp. X-1 TaxID=2571115 RepID=UPI00110B93EA|nr:hypothetical protein [Pseudoxanthomonas sp. X-1]TMN19309.1 hypothetical protein FF950_12015 [Pseudoxanthomonas sp. X-1]UAY74167.1 hypothetical protein LAJ50_17115 [Pseudoxanthomonas sp. X-1]
MNTIKNAVALLALGGLLAGCLDKTGTGSETATATSQPAQTDPSAINAPIPAEAYGVKLSVTDAPSVAADGKSATYQVRIENDGTAPVYGAGTNPVNLGIIILGSDNTIDGPGGTREFIRVPLPLLPPGQAATVVATIPVDARIDGKTLRFATVQEGVAWHDSSNTVDAGPFHIADGKFADAPAAK